MGEIIATIDGLKREKDYLYYVKFTGNSCNVCKAKMMHGGKKKKASKKK